MEKEVAIMSILRIAICDTNPIELERYASLCQAVCEQKQVQAEFATFPSSGALLFQMMHPAFASAVSILVLEPFNGCEQVAAQARGYGYDGIILYHSIVTDKRYFYEAFDAGAYNYIEKGGMARFEAVFERTLKAARDLERQYLALRFAGEYRQIDLRDIHFFETRMNHMVCVCYTGGEFLFRSSMSELEARLERGFVRTHRSFLVALGAICQITYNQAMLSNGTPIPVGRSYYATLKDALDKWCQI